MQRTCIFRFLLQNTATMALSHMIEMSHFARSQCNTAQSIQITVYGMLQYFFLFVFKLYFYLIVDNKYFQRYRNSVQAYTALWKTYILWFMLYFICLNRIRDKNYFLAYRNDTQESIHTSMERINTCFDNSPPTKHRQSSG